MEIGNDDAVGWRAGIIVKSRSDVLTIDLEPNKYCADSSSFESVSNPHSLHSLLLQPNIQNEDFPRPPRRCGICLRPLDMAGTVGWLNRPGWKVRPHCERQQPD
jgi:hypothetical protein